MDKITPCLWFDGTAEAAIDFYLATFKTGRIVEVTRNGDAGPGPKGSVLVIYFELFGRSFIALNGGPLYKFTEAISMSVDCETQAEVDALWAKLSEGGQPLACGWVKDKFGLPWQVVPRRLPELLRSPDPAAAERVMRAMMTMIKLDIAALEAAARG